MGYNPYMKHSLQFCADLEALLVQGIAVDRFAMHFASEVVGTVGTNALQGLSHLLRDLQIRREALVDRRFVCQIVVDTETTVIADFMLMGHLVRPLDGVFPLGQPVTIPSLLRLERQGEQIIRYFDPWQMRTGPDAPDAFADALAGKNSSPVWSKMQPEKTHWCRKLGLPLYLARIAAHIFLGNEVATIVESEHLSKSTVRTYFRRLYAALRVTTRTQMLQSLVDASTDSPLASHKPAAR